MRLRELTLAVALLLLSAAPAAARPPSDPLRLWSISNVRQGVGTQEVTGGAQLGGTLTKKVELGPAAFPFPESNPRDRATAKVFSSASGKTYSVFAQAPSFNPTQPRSPLGGISHLDELQAYEKRSGGASLKLTITKAVLDAIDANHALLPSECPPGFECNPVRGIVRFHARAYAESAGGDFFAVGGVAYIEGHEGRWAIDAVTSSDSSRPLWDTGDFNVDDDVEDFGTRSHAVAELRHRGVALRVPLGSVREGELFAVHVSMDAEAIDSRGRESAAEAFIQDPQEGGSPLFTAHRLRPRGKPPFKEPKVEAPPAARCPSGPARNAGALELSAPAFAAGEGSGAPMVLVTRTGGAGGSASVVLEARAASASAGSDFRSTSTRVRFAGGDQSPRLVEIPIREDEAVEPAETLTVALADARCAKLGAQRSAEVTILDDDAGPPQPLPGFTIGGSVDGLEGSGLVLADLGTELAVTDNGSFTFPGTRGAGLPYDVRVNTQPRNPDQVCAIERGSGTVSGDVTDIAVHCTTPVPSSGLDPTFDDDGRVSTPVGGAGQGEAVVLQPDGEIVTAGRRSTPTGLDFALTRHDTSGQLDTAFGDGGIASTDLGSADDQALDAALLPGGGIVAVGRTLSTGPGNLDLALVGYQPDGTPDPGFGTGGIVKTDVFGATDLANAVAVQPDGKIVVAGLATGGGPTLPDGDFVVVRYDPDGTPDGTFGDDGIVTTDLGTRADTARALVIRPDGELVVAGTADDDVALARYTADGELDDTFGDHGTRVTDFGSDDFANGVALTPDGHILVAGFGLGAGGNFDFLLARYSADGTLDTSFGDGGSVTTEVGGGDDFAENLVVDPAGRIVLVGRATSSTILDMALVRYRPDGTLDPAFDGDGILTADFHGKGEFGQDLALDATGRIVAGGYTANGTDTEFALIRANP